MTKNRCPSCKLVNAITDDHCRRCGATLTEWPGENTDIGEEVVTRRSLGKRLAWILSATLFSVFCAYFSLRLTSDDLNFDQRQTVYRSIAVLEHSGFSREAQALTFLTTFRNSDNWWNRYLGHRDAYAATNFPFEVMTLYPEFFSDSTDDQERAVILLHEARHLFGSGEAAALEYVWREKKRLGWVEAKYSETRVWNNTKELTMSLVPTLFQCGPDGKADCVP